ncbi:MAG: integron integrase [Ardenticatenaceae bacterium]|nr:integron integrase [Ardenticatenaceae bacterium]
MKSRHPKNLLDQVRDTIRLKHYSIRTEESYGAWIRRFIRLHDKRHPREMGGPESEAFLSHLAGDQQVGAAPQNQALSALLLLDREVLRQKLDVPINAIRAQRPRRLPVVLTRDEVLAVLGRLSGVHELVAKVLYGRGLRLKECVRLRVKDLDVAQRQVVVGDGKGMKARITMLPERLIAPRQDQRADAKRLHTADLARGYGAVYLPCALDRQDPKAEREWHWQWVCASDRLSAGPRSGIVRRHHINERGIQKAVRAGAQRAGIRKPVRCHTFRHSLAPHLLENGYDIRPVQELLGHKAVKTTMISTHGLNRGGLAGKRQLELRIDDN